MLEKSARTKTLAGKYGAEAYKRLRLIKGLVRTAIVERDVFGLRSDAGAETLAQAPDREAFDFPTTERKRQAFMSWFRDALAEEFLEPISDEQVRLGNHWSAKYIRSAFRGGLRDSGTRLREFGVEPKRGRDELDMVFNLPLSTRQVERLYLRSFEELEDITEELSDELSQILAEGLVAGDKPAWSAPAVAQDRDQQGPRTIAQKINEQIGIAISRARTIARTETAASYNNSSAVRYKENGITEVNVVNPDPCEEICAPIIAQNPWPIEEAIDLIPGRTHPNCVGGLSPATVLRSPGEGIAGIDY